MNTNLFPQYNLPVALIEDIKRQNPWWTGAAMKPVPEFKRWPFNKILSRLREPIAPIIVIRGPRQIGKTTLQEQIIKKFLADGVEPSRIMRVQFDEIPSLGLVRNEDEPILRITDWYEKTVLGKTLNDSAQQGKPAFLFFDEVQNLTSWDVQLKSLVDSSAARALVTGSSALRIEKGRDSLAGRIQTIEVGPLRLAEICALRGFGPLNPVQEDNGAGDWIKADFWRQVRQTGQQQSKIRDIAFSAFSERGAYPFCHVSANVGWQEIADHLNETVVRRVIEHDLRIGERGRKRDKQLLNEVFRMACRWIGQAPNPATLAKEANAQLGSGIGPQRIKHYVDFLDSSLLIRAIKPLEMRIKKRKGYDKFCLCDHAIRAAWLQEVIPLDPAKLDSVPHLHDLAGRVAESAAGYFFTSLPGLDLAHLPERSGEPEVDFVLTIGENRIPVEIKYRGQIDAIKDTLGLRVFLEKAANNASFGILVTRDDDTSLLDPRIICIPLKTLLIVR